MKKNQVIVLALATILSYKDPTLTKGILIFEVESVVTTSSLSNKLAN
jgi:hypothetical protein